MKNSFTFSSLIMLALILNIIKSFDLYGNWSLQKMKDFLIIYEPTVMNLQQFIFRNTTVQQQLSFNGCKSFKYILSVQQNNLFINYNTYYNNGPSNILCNSSIQSQSSFLIQSLKKCLTFQIFSSRLIFYDLNNASVLQFQRIFGERATLATFFNNSILNIVQIYSKRGNQTLNTTNQAVSLCSGKVVLAYQTGMAGNYSVKFTLATNEVCNTSLNSQNALLSAAFYRINNKTLQLYDNSVTLIVLIEKIITQSTHNQTPSETNRSPSNRTNETSWNTSNPTKNETIQPFPQVSSAIDIQGQWQSALIYSISVPSSSIYLIITGNSISFNGGCNSYIFQYSIQSNTGDLIIGKNMSTNATCQVDDDPLYLTAISSAKKYAITNNSGRIVLALQDINGINVFVLVKLITQTQSTANSTDNQTTTANATSIASNSSNSISNSNGSNGSSSSNSSKSPNIQNSLIGILATRYIFLLTVRRDLPRTFTTILSSSLSYKTSCSTITQSFTIKSQFQITISPPLIPSNCLNSTINDVYSGEFTSVKYYYKGTQMGSYQLNDANNQTRVYLSLL